jgi:hypothetical protein
VATDSAGVIRTAHDAVISAPTGAAAVSLWAVSPVRSIDNTLSHRRLRGRPTGTAVFHPSRPGELFGVSASHRLDPQWTIHGQLWSLSGDPRIADHQTVATAARYLAPDNSRSLQLNALGDSEGNVGLWADAFRHFGLWKHRVGAFRLDPGLLWTDALIANDQQGIYWRTDVFRQRYNVSLGLDASQTNIDDDPTRTGIDVLQGFASGSYRVDRLTSVGATLDLTDTRQGPGCRPPPCLEPSRPGCSPPACSRSVRGASRCSTRTRLRRSAPTSRRSSPGSTSGRAARTAT